MKRLFSSVVSICICLTLSACFAEAPYVPPINTDPAVVPTVPTQSVTPTATAPVTTEATTTPQFTNEPYPYPLTAVSLPIHENIRYAEDGKALFHYSYQTMSLVTPYADAAHSIAIHFLNQTDFSNSAAAAVDQAAVAAYSAQEDWTPYFYHVVYSPMRLDQSVLSLYGTKSYYDGAPHSNVIASGLTYDLVHGTVLSLPQLLVPHYDSALLSDLICKNFPEALTESFYPDYRDVILDMFSTNIPVQDWYLTQDGLCFFFNPGEIAPYSEEIPASTIPYSELNGLLQDAYFPAEFAEYYGRVTFSEVSAEDIISSAQFAELIEDPEGSYFCLSSVGAVQDLQILTGSWNGDTFTPTGSVFAAQALSAGDTIMIQAKQEWIDKICISYLSGSERYQVPAKDAVIVYGE